MQDRHYAKEANLVAQAGRYSNHLDQLEILSGSQASNL